MLKPTIIESERLLLAGFSFYGDPFQKSGGWTEENEIGRLWQRWMAYLKRCEGDVPGVSAIEIAYEVHISHEETATMGNYELFVGSRIDDLSLVPPDVLVKPLPATKYAVFTIAGELIVGDWPRMIYAEWLPQSGYEVAFEYNFQYYDNRFKGLDQVADSIIDVYVPIRPKVG